MESTNTPLINGQGSDDLSGFLEELAVLQRAAHILEIPVRDLIDFRKSRNRVEKPRRRECEPIDQVHGRSDPVASSLGPWLGNRPILGSGISFNDNFPLPPCDATAVGTEGHSDLNSAANTYPMNPGTLPDLSLVHPATLTSIPNINLAVNSATERNTSYANLSSQGRQNLHESWFSNLQDLAFPNLDPNPVSEDLGQSFIDCGLEHEHLSDELQSNGLNTESAGILASPSTQYLVSGRSRLLTPPGNGSRLDLNDVMSSCSVPEAAHSHLRTRQDSSQHTVDSPSMTQEDQHFMVPASLDSSGPAAKFRQIRPRAKHQAEASGSSTSSESPQSLPNPVVLNVASVQKPKRRGPLKLCQRLETSETRKSKACIRCHMQRSRCLPNPDDPFGDCLTCVRLKGPTLSQLPCLRYKISDSQLLDKGPHPRFSWTRRWTSMKICEIEEWKSPSTKTITLTQDVGHASFNLQVREFIPLPGDSLVRSWNAADGVRSHPCAPYAIANMRETGQVFIDFVDTHIQTFLDYHIDKDDPLLTKTYQMAFDHSRSSQVVPLVCAQEGFSALTSMQVKDERVLLDSVLRLWVGSRMESKQERISSEEVLGMTPQDWDPDAGNYGKYLVPPVLQAQIEILTTSIILLPMKRQVLKLLQRLIEKNAIKSWLTIYLTLFILLHSCSMLTRAEAVRAAREAPRGAQSKYFNHNIVEEFHSGARTMLAYFHYCNKGSHPFSMDWSRAKTVSFAQLDTRQAQFMTETVMLVKDKRSHFEHIKLNKLFEDDYYFISQLYELHWHPTYTI
ncbi:hypothetical protein NUW58_g1238 [Xylaria curta]|uniref:Uncharacterized protein n=1 Tax=Xylaria curta TaxID=42375 RepID=A0ACC1PNM9_9PEZI|nr:hypothetical protein NUW58_g1238 [Xylaria curta]